MQLDAGQSGGQDGVEGEAVRARQWGKPEARSQRAGTSTAECGLLLCRQVTRRPASGKRLLCFVVTGRCLLAPCSRCLLVRAVADVVWKSGVPWEAGS